MLATSQLLLAAPLRPRAASRRAAVVSCHAPAPTSAQSATVSSRRGAALAGAALLLSSVLPGQASAFLGFGEKSGEEVYSEDTQGVISQMRATLSLPKDDPSQADSIAAMRKVTNEWVAKYRRNGSFTGRASYGNTYSALNAVAGHYNNFGTKYPLPAKRAERALKELGDAELLLSRGR